MICLQQPERNVGTLEEVSCGTLPEHFFSTMFLGVHAKRKICEEED